MLRKHRYYKPKRKLYHAVNAPSVKKEKTAFRASTAKSIVGTIFFSACVIWFGYFFLMSDSFLIKTVQILGNENIPIMELRNIIENRLTEKRWIIFPNRNIILFDKDQVISDIKDKYIVDDIRIKKQYPFRIKLQLKEKLARVALREKTPINIIRAPALPSREGDDTGSVIGEDVSHNIEEENKEEKQGTEDIRYNEQYYYLDVNGIVVSDLGAYYKVQPDLPLIEIESNEQTKLSPGDVVLDREKIEFIFSVYQEIKRSKEGISVSYIIFDPSADKELSFMTEEGWQGILSTEISVETQIKKLELALQEKIKTQRSILQYVDLRIKDRVYFK